MGGPYAASCPIGFPRALHGVIIGMHRVRERIGGESRPAFCGAGPVSMWHRFPTGEAFNRIHGHRAREAQVPHPF